MDLENLDLSAFDTEFLQALVKKAYKVGLSEGYGTGFTTGVCSVVSVAKKKGAKKALKNAEGFINGPLADKNAKAKFDELEKMNWEVD